MGLILTTIYLSFMGLGLYGSMLGTVWPIMHTEFGVNISYASLFPLIATCGTVLAGIFNERIVKKISAPKLAFIGMVITAISMFAFSFASSYITILIIALPLGLGSGSLDVVINHYTALYYRLPFAGWGHCAWGIGAFLGPIIASGFLKNGQWRGAYVVIGTIQLLVAFLILGVRKTWEQPREPVNKVMTLESDEDKKPKKLSLVPGFIPAVVAAFLYSGVENSTNFWGSSFLVTSRHLSMELAASGMSIFFASLMISRFLSGFFAMKFGYKKISNVAKVFMLAGILLLIIPLKSQLFLFVGLSVLGFSCGPIFTGIINQTPETFGYQLAPKIISMQMTGSFIGGAVLPQLIGILSRNESIGILPVLLLCYTTLFIFAAFLASKRSKVNSK